MAKKDFSNAVNPGIDDATLGFVLTPVESKSLPIASKDVNIPAKAAPEGYKVDHRYIQTRSRRVQLMMQPDLHDAIKLKAQRSGISVNEYIHGLLESVLSDEIAEVARQK